MKAYKRSERVIKVTALLTAMKATGNTVKNIGEFCKWKELDNGKIQMKMEIYEINNGMTCYIMKDTLGMLAAPVTENKQEVLDWLKGHGYKPIKDWYLEDYGMDEETWEEWNK